MRCGIECVSKTDSIKEKWLFKVIILLSLHVQRCMSFFESILLDNPHKAVVLSVGCASFSSTLFPSTQLSVNMLGYSTL